MGEANRRPVDDGELRRRAFERDGYECRVCSEDGDGASSLEVHHIVPLSEGGERQLGNLITLCSNCHRKADYGDLKEELSAELSEEVTEQVDRKVRTAAQRQAVATDHARKVRAFSDDSLDLLKIVLLSGSIAVPAVSFVSRANGGESAQFEGAYLAVFGVTWFCALLAAGGSYYWGRTRGFSAEALELQFESDETAAAEIQTEMATTYRRHLSLIIASVCCLVVSLAVLMLGIADAFGAVQVPLSTTP